MGIDLITNRRVALKTQAASSEECTREFAFLSALGAHPSPHVAAMLDYFTTMSSGRRLLVTVHDLADSTLWHVFRSLKGEPTLPASSLSRYMSGVALGLQHMYRLNVVHGDASLKNMLISRNDAVKIADFGSAHSALGAVVGEEFTTAYVRTPERSLGLQEVRPDIDVWAFGVQLWALSTGQCEWMFLKSGNLESDEGIGEFLSTLTGVIGPTPTVLESLPRWHGVSKHLAATPAKQSAATPINSVAHDLVSRCMLWDWSCRANWTVILDHDLFKFTVDRAAIVGACALEAPLASQHALGAVSSSAVAPPAPGRSLASAHALAAENSAATASRAPDRTPQATYERCHCKGSCGSKLHKLRANQLYRKGAKVDICERPVQQGERYCTRCMCERYGCSSQRLLKHNRRWCCVHAIVDLRKNQYVVPSGTRSFERDWSLRLRAIARMSFLFPHIEPADLTELMSLIIRCRLLSAWRAGDAITSVLFAIVFIGHLIKWPPAVRQWSELNKNVLETKSVSAELLVSRLRALLRWCDGKRWPAMFERMNAVGLMDAQTGLAVYAGRLGLIARVQTAPKTKRIRSKGPDKPSEPQRPRDGTVLALGRAGTEYVELADSAPAVQIVQALMDSMTQCSLSLPSHPHEVESFADMILEIVKNVRSLKVGDCTLKGGFSPGQYSAKHFVRTLLLAIEVETPALLDPLPFDMLSKWCPDVGCHAAELLERRDDANVTPSRREGLLTCAAIRNAFGCSPLMWHCWACLLGTDQALIAKVLDATDHDLWRAVLDDEAATVIDGFPFPPGPLAIMRALTMVETQSSRPRGGKRRIRCGTT